MAEESKRRPHLTLQHSSRQDHWLPLMLDDVASPWRLHWWFYVGGSGYQNRSWPYKVKLRIVVETLVPGAMVDDVARQHGLPHECPVE